MGIQRSNEEKLRLLDEFFSSNMKLGSFAKSKGIPVTTITQWVNKFYKVYNQDGVENELATSNKTLEKQDVDEPKFIDVTAEARNACEVKAEIQQSSNIKISINGYLLEFDVSYLNDIIRSLK